jgi:hypothetical protein
MIAGAEAASRDIFTKDLRSGVGFMVVPFG